MEQQAGSKRRFYRRARRSKIAPDAEGVEDTAPNDDFVEYPHDLDDASGGHDITDIDSLTDKLVLHDDAVTPFPADVDLQEIQQADQYDDEIAATVETDPFLDAIPTQLFDEEASDTPLSASTPSVDDFDIDDDSEAVPHARAKTATSEFSIALGL